MTFNGVTYAVDSDVHQAINIGNGSLSNQVQKPLDQNSSNKSTVKIRHLGRGEFIWGIGGPGQNPQISSPKCFLKN